MGLMDTIRAKAKQDLKTIVFPEGAEERTIKAAVQIVKEGTCKPVLLGNVAKIREMAAGVDLSGVTIIDPEASDQLAAYADAFYQLRKDKGVTEEKALATVKDTIYFGTMMVQTGDADGLVSGAIHTTADTLRPALQIIKTAPGISTASSCFIMECPNTAYGDKGVLVFADCAVNISPDAKQLAAIAISSAATAKALCAMEPRVAMLSFSTKGSGAHADADKVVEATKLAKEIAPELMIDGELQADAALVEKVGQLKSPGSPVAGKANVLIFPDLDAGNIGYKLVQRLAGAEAIGPIMQGLRKPVNDLSRGCSVEDIAAVAAMTAVQAQSM